MNENTYDILESCLQELDNGIGVEAVLSRYPKFAEELRPILKAASQAKKMSAPAPSQAAVIRGRARLMQQVAEKREGKIAPRKRVIPFFQRIAISFTMTAMLLLSGTGLVSASSSALPGQNLYPVKRNWESVRLFFAFDPNSRVLLEDEFKLEREHEANELLSEREEYEVEFSGVLSTVNGTTYISTLPVVFPAGTQLPADGTALEIKGRTTDKGYVEVIEFEISDERDVPSGGNQDSNEGGDEGHEGDEGNIIPSLKAPEQKSLENKNGSEVASTPTLTLSEKAESSKEKEEGRSSDTEKKDNESESSEDDLPSSD